MKILVVQNRMGIGETVIFLPFIEAISRKFDTPVSLLVKKSSKADQYIKHTDYLDKLTAICMQCGKDATYTQRITKQTQQVVIGETDTYEARCRSCFDPPSI